MRHTSWLVAADGCGRIGESGASWMSIHRFDLDSRGLARVLGDLEARIMDAVWRRGVSTINDICGTLDPPTHYKTVLTVANRLVQKGLLTREPTPDRAF